jgi:Mg2+ and Co2+ transporter CorA
MSTNIEELAKRVAYLEREMRRKSDVIDGIEQRNDTRLQAIEAHIDRQDKDQQDFKESIDKRFEQLDTRLDKFEASVDKRFEHVYGQLTNINANMTEVRNILVSLVAKLS